jgi:hypothetical protein
MFETGASVKRMADANLSTDTKLALPLSTTAADYLKVLLDYSCRRLHVVNHVSSFVIEIQRWRLASP